MRIVQVEISPNEHRLNVVLVSITATVVDMKILLYWARVSFQPIQRAIEP